MRADADAPVETDGDRDAAALIARLRRHLGSSEEIATVGRMTAGIAQELNSPLTALLGSLSRMTDLLREDGSQKSPTEIAELRASLLECVTVTDRIKNLVGAIRGVSRRDHRSAVFFDTARAIRDATRIFAVVHQRDCRIDLGMGPLPALYGSPNRLGQVLLNLLQNGLDASLELQHDGRTRLAVAASATDTDIQITVTDHGAGIPPEIAPRIFEEFFTSKDADRGRGLGLALSRQIVTEMGGSIGFESVPGNTVFTVRLPFAN